MQEESAKCRSTSAAMFRLAVPAEASTPTCTCKRNPLQMPEHERGFAAKGATIRRPFSSIETTRGLDCSHAVVWSQVCHRSHLQNKVRQVYPKVGISSILRACLITCSRWLSLAPGPSPKGRGEPRLPSPCAGQRLASTDPCLLPKGEGSRASLLHEHVKDLLRLTRACSPRARGAAPPFSRWEKGRG